jgi:Tol biopolymer transport system component
MIAISPDGMNVVYAANQQLYLRSMVDLQARPIQGTSQNSSRPFFSPDGKWIGYVARAEQKVKKVAITGGAAVTISDVDELNSGFGPVWNVDGYIYVGQPKGMVRVSANGGKFEDHHAERHRDCSSSTASSRR